MPDTNTDNSLRGLQVAMLATDGFEQSELIEPLKALEAAGADVSVISLREDSIRGWNRAEWGQSIAVDTTIADADPNDYGALVLPGGVINADALRLQRLAVTFVRGFFDAKKPVAAICHAPWILVESGDARGRRLTSWPSLKTDLTNSGAHWVDEEVVVDGTLVTSRKPDDLPAFNREITRIFSRGVRRPAPAGKPRPHQSSLI